MSEYAGWQDLPRQDKLDLLVGLIRQWPVKDIEYLLGEEIHKVENPYSPPEFFPDVDEMLGFIRDIIRPQKTESPSVVVALGDSTSSTEEEE
jgi:hypothetical protein